MPGVREGGVAARLQLDEESGRYVRDGLELHGGDVLALALEGVPENAVRTVPESRTSRFAAHGFEKDRPMTPLRDVPASVGTRWLGQRGATVRDGLLGADLGQGAEERRHAPMPDDAPDQTSNGDSGSLRSTGCPISRRRRKV